MEFLGIFLAFLIGLWVAGDAERRGKSKPAAFFWFLGTWLLLIIFLPIWLLSRPRLAEEAAPVRLVSAPRLCMHCGKYYESEPRHCPNCGHSVVQ